MSDIEAELTAALAAEAAADNPTFDLEGVLLAAGTAPSALHAMPGTVTSRLESLTSGLPRREWLVAACAVVLLGLGVAAMIQIGGRPVDLATEPGDGTRVSAADSELASGVTTGHGQAGAVPGDGCAAGPSVVPEGASVAGTVDVDGDGEPDRAWIQSLADGGTEVGIVTAAGGGATRDFVSGSPVSRSILVVDVDGRGPVEILASDGRSVQLWAFVGCEIVDVTNVQGEVYTFSLGFSSIGTGVGCVRIGGQRELVGLHVVSDDGTEVEWSRTVVSLDGTEARNGRTDGGTFTRPDDNRAIELLHEVSCGSLTMANDGISAS